MSDPDPPSASAAKTSVFISYSRRDLAFVDRLAAGLETHGISPTIDRSEIYAFEDWWKRIETLVGAADAIVFVLSPDAIASETCRKEVDYALALNKRFAPIVCRAVAAQMHAIPPALANLNFIFFDEPDRFDAALEELVEALTTDIGWIRFHTEYGLDAADWEKAGRPHGLLLRSPRLEAAERWIATRPAGAPVPSEATQAFVLASRRNATRRRNLLTGSLAAGLVVAVGLAGLALWQRGEAIAQRHQAEAQRLLAERNFAAAKTTVDGLIFNIAQGLENVAGMRVETIRDILGTVEQSINKLLETAPNDTGLLHSRAIMLDNFATIYMKAGARADALHAVEERLAISLDLAKRQPQKLAWALDVISSLNAAGDIEMQIGQIGSAASYFLRARKMERILLPGHPDDVALIEQDIVTLNFLGDIEEKVGHFGGAIKFYQAGLHEARKLAARDPKHAGAIRRVTLGLSRISAAKEETGDLAGAAEALGEVVEQSRARAATNPDDLLAQRDLSIELEKVAKAKLRAGDETGGLAAYEEVLSIVRRLERLDPSNELARRDLALTLENIGTVKMSRADRTGAISAFEESLSSRRKFAEHDPGNAEAQRDLSFAYDKLAQARLTAGDAKGALVAALEGLKLARDLSARDPQDPRAQRDVASSLLDTGESRLVSGDKAGALKDFEECLRLTRDIAIKDKLNRQAQRDLYSYLVDIGSTLLEQKERADALVFYRQGLDVAEQLVATNSGDTKAKKDLVWLRGRVADLEK